MMSFDISFIKSKNLSPDNIHELLESAGQEPEGELFIDLDLRNQLVQAIQDAGLRFDLFEPKDGHKVELTFETYQVAIYQTSVWISMPYWAANSDEKVIRETQVLMGILFAHGFTGFDPQNEVIFTEPYEFKSNFEAARTIVDQHMRKVKKPVSPITWLWIVLGAVLVAVLIWNGMQAG